MSTSSKPIDGSINQSISFTRITSNKPKELRKHYYVNDDGQVCKVSVANMTNGIAYTEIIPDLKVFDTVLSKTKKNECFSSGLFPSAECWVLTKREARPEKNIYARAKEYLTPPKDGLYLQLLDNDPHEDGVTFETAQQALDYIRDLHPSFAELEILVRPSSSAGIQFNGELIKPFPAWHAFIKVHSDVPVNAIANAVNGLCWARGDGYIALAKNGAKLVRSTFDMSVFSHEGLMFEANPKLGDGFTRLKYQSAHQVGDALTLDKLPQVDNAKIDVLIAQAKADIEPQAKQKEETFKEEKLTELVSKGINEDRAKAIVNALGSRDLTLDTYIQLQDGSFISVRELCDQHALYDGVAMPDPIEGINYGVTTAKFYWNDGRPVINSHAHGGCVFKLVETYQPPATTTQVTPLNERLAPIDFPHASVTDSGLVHIPQTIEAVAHLMECYGFTARYNTITKATEISTPLDKSIIQDNSFDFGVNLLTSQAALNGLPFGQLPNYVNAIAQAGYYNPIIDWFKSREWDGHSRLRELLDCIQVENGWEDARDTYVRKWLMSGAGMQLNTGNFSTRGTLVFSGAQNIGKTYFLQLLAGDMWKYCLDGLTLNPSDRDSVKKYCSQWLVELGELDATFRKSDISALKAFLTLKKDEMRLPYARGESIFPRRTVAIASVNDRSFLRDDTGNSRYWCLPVTGFDHTGLRNLDMQQLWAEVWLEVTRLMDNDPVNLPWFLSDEENCLLAERNKEFEEPCEITAALLRYIEPCNGDDLAPLHSAKDIAKLLQLPNGQKTSNIIGKVMRDKLGYEIATPRNKRCYRVEVPNIADVATMACFQRLA